MSSITAGLDRLRRLLAALAVGGLILVPVAGCNDDGESSDNGDETSEVEDGGDNLDEGDDMGDDEGDDMGGDDEG